MLPYLRSGALSQTRGFRLLPHTADIRVEVRGKNLAGLYAAGVEALFSLMVDRRSVRAAAARSFTVSGNDPEERLFLLLREALLLFSLDGFLVRTARATIKNTDVEMKVSGEPFDPSRHAASREIKAVTAHGMTVRRVPGGCIARFIVDV
ncbi:MAG: putative cytosolic protein [Actinobacteria bacterium]|nr:putative cytosolic protein [Actinomycetota bacterium]